MLSHLSLFNLFAIAIGINLQHYHNKKEAEFTNSFWETMAKTDIFQAYSREILNRKAKNVIIFVGGGMGLSTITPTRILKGQIDNSPGEDEKLAFETFPNTCLLKTYTVDNQVPDTEGSATAILSGVKTNNGVIGVTARVRRSEANCETVRNNMVTSIFDVAHEAGMYTGIVTNTRLTEGMSAGSYASVADSDWETNIPLKFAKHPTQEDCLDIGRQLIENHPGKNFNVILGSGGLYLIGKDQVDNATGKNGMREDNINLIDKWSVLKRSSGLKEEQYKYVNDRSSLMAAMENSEKLDYLFGVFSQMNFEMERDLHKEPSLEDMTEVAISVMKKNEKGYILMVENGLIDMAHHDNLANMALYETLALEEAIERAMEMVSLKDTLIIVTADHGQAISMNGYQPRGHNIMGIAGKEDNSHKPFTTLLYTNGPGYTKIRADPKLSDISALRYKSYAGVFLESSYHTGEDVGLYSVGPMSHIFHGVKEMSYVCHAMEFATCIGPYQSYSHCGEGPETRVFSVNEKKRTTISIAPESQKSSICLFFALNLSIILFQLLKI